MVKQQLTKGDEVKITLIANPSDAPCCVKIECEDGQDRLIQTDWDFPGIANTFGWSVREVQRDSVGLHYRMKPCEHLHTDGTVDCKACAVTASMFITAARQWIDDNDGATVDDPGYFEAQLPEVRIEKDYVRHEYVTACKESEGK